MPELSVIIPAFNEENRLPKTLESVHDYLTESHADFEIVVVNDGSRDGTVASVQEFARHRDRIRLISYASNQGKGHAVRTGVMAAAGDLVLMNDADGSSPIEEIEKLIAALDGGADVAIGSRAKPDPAGAVHVQALAYRKHIGNTFNLIVQTLLLPGILDTQCGFKLFKRSAAREIFPAAILNGYAFDVEILYVTRKRGYTIAEVPINWHNVAGSKVNVMIDSPRMFLEVLTIFFGRLTGKYRKAVNTNSVKAVAQSSTLQSSEPPQGQIEKAEL